MRQTQGRRIAEILAADDVPAQFELPTPVLEAADVLHHLVVYHRRHRGVGQIEHVVDLAEVEVELTPEAVVEKREVETEVELGFLLPLQVGVDIADRTVTGLPDPVGGPHVVGFVHAGRIAVPEAVVTRDAVTQAHLEVADPADVAHERFVRETPAARNGPEITPAVVHAELRGTLAAEAHRSHVTVFIRIVGTPEHREQALAGILVRIHRGTAGREVRTHAHVPATTSSVWSSRNTRW